MPEKRRTAEQEQARYGKGFMRTQEVADVLGVSRSHVIHLIDKGELGAVDISVGSRAEYRVAVAALDAFLEARKVA